MARMYLLDEFSSTCILEHVAMDLALQMRSGSEYCQAASLCDSKGHEEDSSSQQQLKVEVQFGKGVHRCRTCIIMIHGTVCPPTTASTPNMLGRGLQHRSICDMPGMSYDSLRPPPRQEALIGRKKST
eukprot:1710600-Amphidinium_carterae.1